MIERERFPREAWVPIVAGWLWLWQIPGSGVVAGLLALVPGSLLLGAGVALLLMPGDRRIEQLGALGGIGGVLLALPAGLAFGLGAMLLLALASGASALAAGAHALRVEPNVDEVPEPRASVALAAQVAVDEALLATMLLSVPLPARGELGRIRGEVAAARELFDAHGWIEKPESYHVEPPPLEAPELRPARSRSHDYERLSFESGYAPHAEEPGRDRWLAHVPNRTAHAWVVRHGDAERPWLVAINGYQMGWPLIDLLAFDPAVLHHRYGMNLLIPVLPLHGPRKIGRRSGDGFITADTLDMTHALAQAMWDIRRLLSWVRAQGATRIGVLGYSLGGYSAALLAGLDEGLACVIPGIPAADFSRLVYRHGPLDTLREAEREGVDEQNVSAVLRAVSPLAIAPRVPLERRYLFAAVADRLVPPDQVRDLWRAWDRPRIEWYQGAHVTFRAHPGVARLIADALRESGLTG